MSHQVHSGFLDVLESFQKKEDGTEQLADIVKELTGDRSVRQPCTQGDMCGATLSLACNARTWLPMLVNIPGSTAASQVTVASHHGMAAWHCSHGHLPCCMQLAACQTAQSSS